MFPACIPPAAIVLAYSGMMCTAVYASGTYTVVHSVAVYNLVSLEDCVSGFMSIE